MTKDELTAERDKAEAVVEVIREDIRDLMDYLQGPKFAQDSRVQTSDVVLRLNELLGRVADIEVEPWGISCKVRVHNGVVTHVPHEACAAINHRRDHPFWRAS